MKPTQRVYDEADVAFVHKHYSEMTASQLMRELGLSKFQINKIVAELRGRGVNLPKKEIPYKTAVERYIENNNIPTPFKNKYKNKNKDKS